MTVKFYFKTWGCRHHYQDAQTYCDNAATIFFSKNYKYSKCDKHMELKYFTIKEEIWKRRVLLKNIRTDLRIVDQLTKGLLPKTFKEHAQRMRLGCTYD